MNYQKKILITGGLGYLGSRLARDLSVSGDYHITLTSRRKPEEWPDINMPNIDIKQLDLLNPEAVYEIASIHDIVLHLAGPDEKAVVHQPLDSIDGALKATAVLLEASAKANIEHFFFFSTVHVYGSPLTGYISESTCPKPRHPYGILNRAAEDFVLRYREIHQLNAIVFRLSNVFGAPVHKNITRWSLVVNDLCRMAVEKGYIQLHSDGSQFRDFIPLLDVSKALEQFFSLNIEQTLDGVFNLGSGKGISVFEIAKNIQSEAESFLKKEIPLHRKENQQKLNCPNLTLDVSKLKSVIEWDHQPFELSIQDTLKFCYKEKNL